MSTTTPQLEKLSYSIPNLATAVDLSVTTVRRAIESGELRARYPNRKPIIAREDALEWLRNLPTEKPSAVA